MNKRAFVSILMVSIIISAGIGGLSGYLFSQAKVNLLNVQEKKLVAEENKKVDSALNKQDRVVQVVEKTSPAVVSIIISKDLPKLERIDGQSPMFDHFGGLFNNDPFFEQFFNRPRYRQNGTEKKEIGGGTGFIVSADGYVVTNKHVVADDSAEYTVLLNDGKKIEAKVLAKDPVHDLAVLKIKGKDLPVLQLGDSSTLKVGQSVIAIGNALGEFRNTVSTGVVSGLSRSITAYGGLQGGQNLLGLIQTDASINPGNSGGPLLDLNGKVIGINVAIATSAQNIGFAIPINQVKNVISSVQKNGKLIRPWLGVRYVQIDEKLAEKNNLDYDYGALIIRGQDPTDLAVVPGSPADKAGLQENDIILEIDGVKLDKDHYLASVISNHKPGDTIKLKIVHQGKEKEVVVKLSEFKDKFTKKKKK